MKRIISGRNFREPMTASTSRSAQEQDPLRAAEESPRLVHQCGGRVHTAALLYYTSFKVSDMPARLLYCTELSPARSKHPGPCLLPPRSSDSILLACHCGAGTMPACLALQEQRISAICSRVTGYAPGSVIWDVELTSCFQHHNKGQAKKWDRKLP